MPGRIYISVPELHSSQAKKRKSRRRSRKRYRSRGSRSHIRSRSQNSHRPSRSLWLSLFSSEEMGPGAHNYDDYEMTWLVPATCEPIQSVYFFSGGGSLCLP